MKIQEIRKMTKEEMNDKILLLKKELFNVKLNINLSKFKNTSMVRKIKKNIARINTVFNEKDSKKLINNNFTSHVVIKKKNFLEDQQGISSDMVEESSQAIQPEIVKKEV